MDLLMIFRAKQPFPDRAALIIEELELAVPLATNEDIKEYLKLLIESLNTGDLGRHVAAGKSWVKALNQRTDSWVPSQLKYVVREGSCVS